jgi:hypothetical protein
MSDDLRMFHEFLDSPLPYIAVVGLFMVVVSLAKGIGATIRSANRERTRREIAAYIAEGSMTPEQGERLMNSGGGGGGGERKC